MLHCTRDTISERAVVEIENGLRISSLSGLPESLPGRPERCAQDDRFSRQLPYRLELGGHCRS
jgi:hypothetical protein